MQNGVSQRNPNPPLDRITYIAAITDNRRKATLISRTLLMGPTIIMQRTRRLRAFLAMSVVVCDVLLHVRQKLEWLRTLHSEMQSGAKLVLIDFQEGELPEGPPEAIKVPKEEVFRLCKEAVSY